MKHFILFIFLIISQLPFYAQPDKQRTGAKRVINVTLSGKILDAKTGESLPGATVYFADDKIGTVADPAGKYILRNVPAGHHVVEISHLGYATLVEHIELVTDLEKNFSLSTVVVENRAVIVTGVSGATSIRKAPIPVSSVRKAVMLQTPSTNIIDALTRVPGVSQLSSGPAISKPFIRGLGYNRVIVVNDGMRQEGQQWGDEHGIEIDELSVVRAEIMKGPASLMYGSDALAGVINLITSAPVAEGTTSGNIFANYQTNNGLYALNGNIAGNKKGFNWNLYGTHKSAGDYKNKFDGQVLNSRFHENNFGGYAGINKGWGYSHLILSRYDQHTGLVEGDRDANGQFIATAEDLDSREMLVPFQRIQHNRIIADNNFAIRKSRLKVNLGYQQNLRQEFGNPVNPSEKELEFDLRTFNYSVHWQLPEMKEWHTTIGVNGMHQDNSNKGTEVLIPEYGLFDVGAFVYAQRIFKKATISGGFRYDNRTLNADAFEQSGLPKFFAFERSFSNISGSAGISYEPSEKITLKANIARGFRAPSIAELASNGVHEGTNRYEYGDQGLDAESSFQFDAGIDLNYEHLSFGISGFYNRINDFIFYRSLESVFGGDSLVHVDGEDIPAFRFNQHNAKLAGLEATLDIHPHPLDWLHFEHSFSFVRGQFDNAIDGSDNLPLIPAPRLVSELRGDFPKAGKTLRNFYGKVEADITFDQKKAFTGFGTETPTDGYALLNAGVGTDIINAKKNTILGIHFSAINITDKSYQSHLSRLKYADVNPATGRVGVFNTGRNFSLKLTIPFSVKRKKVE